MAALMTACGAPLSLQTIMRRGRVALALGVLAASLAGCGRKGDLEPALDPSTKPATSAGESVAPTVRHSRRVPITPSKDPFFLDPLL